MLRREPAQPPSLCTVRQPSALVWITHEGSTAHTLKRLFPGPYPEVSVKALTISHCFHGDSKRADHGVLTWGWASEPLCLPEQVPDALLSLSLIILDGALPPSIKLDWISIKRVIPSSACQKPCLKLAANVIFSINENFPLMHVVVDKDSNSLRVSPCLFLYRSPPPTSHSSN